MAAEQRTHYQVLGLSRSATAEEIRRAHRRLAHLLHPDRQARAGAAERRLAERRMREVNAAWTVLSDPQRRADYDRSLATTARSGTSTDRARRGSGNGGAHGAASTASMSMEDPDADLARSRLAEIDPDEPELPPLHYWLLRRGPILAMLVVAAILFVATAYAGSGSREPIERGMPLTPDAGCVRLDADRNAIGVACSEANDGRVVARVQDVSQCPDGTRYAQQSGGIICIDEQDRASTTTGTGDGG